MAGLSPELNKRLRNGLIECGPFGNHQNLMAVFVDQRIAAYANSLPESTNIEGRVDFLIHHLYDEYDKDNQNVLLLFLYVLLDRTSAQTSCYQKIVQLISMFKEEIGRQNFTSPFPISSIHPPSTANTDTSVIQNDEFVRDSTQIYETLIRRFNEEELRTLCFYLNVEFADLVGDGLSGKARELVQFHGRRGQLPTLVAKIKQVRPDIQL